MNDRIVLTACLLAVLNHSVRQIRLVLIDIYLAEEIIIHKIIIALVVFSWKSLVLVQVYRRYLRKIQIPFFVPLYQLLISTDRRRSVASPSTQFGFIIIWAEIIFAAFLLRSL